MLNQIVQFSLKNRILVLLLTALMIGGGIVTLSKMHLDAFPDTTPVQVQVNTYAPSLNGEEIEQQITLPIELSIGGLPGLKSVRSVSKFGLSQVVAIFDDSVDMIDARQYISERLSSVQLDEGIERPQLGPISTGLGEIFHYTMSSDHPNRTLEEIRTIHDWVIKPQLRKVLGVAEVNSWGGYEKQYHVIVSPSKLIKFKLSLEDVFNALERNNKNVGGGVITSGGQSKLLHGLGRVKSIQEIKNIVIRSYEGNPIRINDISESVQIGHEIRRGAVSSQGQGEAVLGLAFMLMGSNGNVVTEALKKQLENVKKGLPKDIKINLIYDRTELTDKVIDTVNHNLISGAVLVVVVLLVLLGNLRAGFLVALTIPVAMVFAILGMHQFSIAASLLSLGAIDFGILVDGSVVMSEANLRNLSDKTRSLGRPLTASERVGVLINSCRGVARPMVFGMGIILVVFLPILTLENTEGKMFKPMAWTFIFALSGAIVIALVLTPVLNYFFLPKNFKHEKSKFSSIMNQSFAFVLEKVIKAKYIVLSITLCLLVFSFWISSKLGGEFIPRLNEGAIVINTIRLAGVSIDESLAYNSNIEKLLLETYPDEIKYVWSRIGTAEVATDPMGTELTDTFISLHPRENWSKAKTQVELIERIQETVSDLPGLNMVFTQPIEMRLNEMDSGIRSDIGIKIYGDDFDELVRVSDEVQRVLVGIQGQSDVSVDQITGQPTIQIVSNQAALSRLGYSSKHVLDFIETVGGRKVGTVFEGQKRFPLVVRLSDEHRSDIDKLENTFVPSNKGLNIPLRLLADVKKVEGSATINREWGKRLIRVQCNVSGRDVMSFVNEAKRKINERVDLPEGYVIDWGGQFEKLERSKMRLMIVVPMTLLLVFILLYFSLKDLRDVLIIYSGIPFALIGGVLSLWMRGMPFSISAAVGFIALSGIAVLNGQILVSAIREFLNSGEEFKNAITLATTQRLRPVLATAITDAVGFFPMALSTDIGAEVQRPLATVVIGGVATSTLLTLFVLPLLYMIFKKKSQVRE